MKLFLLLPVAFLLSLMTSQAEEDVWYDASGKVVGVTPAEKEKKEFMPDWKKRELARLESQRKAAAGQRTYRSSGSRYYGYPVYYGYGGGYYYSGYPSYRPYFRRGYRSSPRFRGTYRGNGFSVHLNF